MPRTAILLLGILTIAGLDVCVLSMAPRNAQSPSPDGVAATAIGLLAIAALFVLGCKGLGGGTTRPVRSTQWHEISAPFRAPIDYLVMAATGLFSFALSIVNYWNPPGKIFDEVYFARAAEEYLRNQYVYESTHPPLSKLIVTMSVMLFGGLPHGDTAYGWRFLDVVFSALAVMVLYALARRVTGSTIFALVTALFFTLDGMHFVQSRIGTPEGLVILFSLCAMYALYRGWFVRFAVALGLLVGTKWYGVTLFGAALIAILWWKPHRAARTIAAIAFVATCVYALVWVPDLVRQSPDPGEIHTIADVVKRQYTMFEYHYTLRATHPYSSKWWEWPLDYVPIVYYYQDTRPDRSDPNGCCIAEVTSMPNPFDMWLGLLTVPIVAALAWRERNRGYALLVLAYLAQWLPWSLSPRITWEYHFYVDIPLICLCNAIALQRFYDWARKRGQAWRAIAPYGVAAAVLTIAGAFVYFYPVLGAVPIGWEAWHDRMWFTTWIIGPG